MFARNGFTISVFAIMLLAFYVFSGHAQSPQAIQAEDLRIEGLKFSPLKPSIADSLEISGSIKGFRNPAEDWFSVLIYKKGESRDDGKGSLYVARDQVKWNFFKGKPGEASQFKCYVDLSALDEGEYSIFIYAQIKDKAKMKEIAKRLADFKIDNASLFIGSKTPAPQKEIGKPLHALGVEVAPLGGGSGSYPSGFFPARGGTTYLKLPASGQAAYAVCQVKNVSQGQWTCSLESVATDSYCRGGKTALSFTLEPGEARIEKVPLPPTLNGFTLENKRGSGRTLARVVLKLFSGGDLVSDAIMPVRFHCHEPEASPTNVAHFAAPGAPEHRSDPVWGELSLVDSVDCAAEAPWREGGKFINCKYTSEPLAYYDRNKLSFDWHLTYVDATHDTGFSAVAEILGRKCRTSDNWGWFAYELGKGKLQKGARYLVELDYPEDRPRTFCIYNNRAESPSFHTGPTIGDPFTRQRFAGISNLPLASTWTTWRGNVENAKDSVLVSIHSMGDVADPNSAGVAVSSIRLYKIEIPAPAPEIALPEESLPRRSITWLQEDGTPPSRQQLENLKAFGFTGLAPIYLSYCGKGAGGANMGEVNWASKLFKEGRFNNKGAVVDSSLKAAESLGLDVYPTFEFGGTSHFPDEAYAIDPDGSKSRYYWGTTSNGKGERVINRVDGWHCVDAAHPAFAADFARILDELAPVLREHKSIKGIELTHRFNCWQISWSEYEMERFANESGIEVPRLPQAERAQWISANAIDKYWSFFYAKKRENMLAIRDKLQSIRPDLVLHVLNYVADDHMPFGQILYFWTASAKGPDEFIETRKIMRPCLPNFNDNILRIPAKGVEIDLRKLLEDYTRIDTDQPGIHPPLYRNDKGIVIWGPMHYEFTANSPTYLDFFRTGEGLGIYNNIIYNEDCHENNPNLYCPGLEGTEHAGQFCMMEEVMAVAAADPVRLGVRIQTVCRGFPEFGVAFAKAYLSLPALPSEIVDSGIEDKDVVARRIKTPDATYYAIVNRGFSLAGKDVSLNCFPKGAAPVDLVSGEELASSSSGWRLKMSPMSLRAFIVRHPSQKTQ